MNTYLGMYEIHVDDETFHKLVIIKAKDEVAGRAMLRDHQPGNLFIMQAKWILKQMSPQQAEFMTDTMLCETIGN